MIALWYASRATGLVSLLLLSGVVVLGALNTGRFASANWPRFAVARIHRNLSLLAVAFLAVHISTAIIDPYAGIEWFGAVIPFIASYQPFWLGLGAVAFDLLVALIVSSLARPWIPLRLWRALHWGAYVCWPVAVAHGLGIGGADSRLLWVLLFTTGCVVAVVIALVWRASTRHADTQARRRPFQGIR